jgi:hypothetical protein
MAPLAIGIQATAQMVQDPTDVTKICFFKPWEVTFKGSLSSSVLMTYPQSLSFLMSYGFAIGMLQNRFKATTIRSLNIWFGVQFDWTPPWVEEGTGGVQRKAPEIALEVASPEARRATGEGSKPGGKKPERFAARRTAVVV